MPLVSVLLPVYNGQHTLARAIDSILNQTLADFELIIVDNGSTDKTNEIILSYDDMRVKYFYLDHPDLVAALNYGLDQCSAPYVARMDADDVSYPDRLALQSDFLNSKNNYGLASGQVRFIPQHNAEGYTHYVEWANGKKTHNEIYLSRFQESSLPHPSVMFRKSLIEKYGKYRPDVPEDFELWNRWMNEGIKVGKVNQIVLDWHDSHGRLSRVSELYNESAFARIKAEYFSYWFRNTFGSNSPEVYIFGNGKVVKRKSKQLVNHGIDIAAYLDVVNRNNPSTLYYKELEQINNPFVLSYVADRTGKLEVHAYLLSIGMKEGINFYMME